MMHSCYLLGLHLIPSVDLGGVIQEMNVHQRFDLVFAPHRLLIFNLLAGLFEALAD